MPAEALTKTLDEAGARYELLPHAHTERAADEAAALGLAAQDVAKTLVVTTPEGYVRAVIPASERLDLHKLRDVVGGGKKQVHLASEDDLARDYSEFELGAVPPLGGARRDRVLVDRRVAERESVVLEAGSHDESLRIDTADLLRLSGGEVVDVVEEYEPPEAA
jgi:Ala-tRNA(Pro) deacylase